jgi:chromosome segregation ATPase
MAKDRLDRIEEILDRVAKEQEKLVKEIHIVDEQLKRTDEQIMKLKESQRKTDEQIMKLKESQKKTDEQIMKLKESQKKTDEQIMKLKESQKKTDEQLKKTDEQIKKTNEEIRKTNKELRKTSMELRNLIGIQRETTRRLDDTVSRFTEGLLQPSAEKFFMDLGVNVLEIHKRTSRMKKSPSRERLEVDILCLGNVEKKNGLGLEIGKKVAFVIEAKSNLAEEYIKPFVNKQIKRFKEFFTEYRDYVIIGGIGGINVEEDAKERAEEEGLYVFYPSDDNLIVINSPEFKPKIWE